MTVEGKITLLVTTGIEPGQGIDQLTFLILHVPSAYNAILGGPGLNAFGVIIFTYHLMVKFFTHWGVGKVREDQTLAQQYFIATIKGKRSAEALQIEDHREEARKSRGEPTEELVTIPIGGDPTKAIRVGSQLTPEYRDGLVAFLQDNEDIFA